jgi:hypothetical protein
MQPVGFEPKIPARERPQTYVLDRAATETGVVKYYMYKVFIFECNISMKLKNDSLPNIRICFYVENYS